MVSDHPFFSLQPAGSVQMKDPGAAVHHKDGVANALGIGAEVADEHRDETAADAEDQLALLRDGGGDIVSGHEERAESDARLLFRLVATAVCAEISSASSTAGTPRSKHRHQPMPDSIDAHGGGGNDRRSGRQHRQR